MSDFYTRAESGVESGSFARVDTDGAVIVKPGMTTGGNLSVQTAVVGTTFTAFASQACSQLTVANDTGATIEFRQGGAGVAVPVFDGTYFTIFGISDAADIQVRRSDTSNTQVTVKARWEA